MNDSSTHIRKLAEEIGIKHFPGSSTKAGKLYHDIPFAEFKTHRQGTKQRADLILKHLDVKGKDGLDIGCSVGGISFYLQQAGAQMVGIDYDPKVIQFAQAVADEYNCPVAFINEKITAISYTGFDGYDFAVWFDNWMWIEKQNGFEAAANLLNLISKKIPVLFFSTSQGDGQAKKGKIQTVKDVQNLLEQHTEYTSITNLGAVNDNWHKRSIFVCKR